MHVRVRAVRLHQTAPPALLLHAQVIAFCLYSAPLYYMAEKALRVHNAHIGLRILARLPVCECRGRVVADRSARAHAVQPLTLLPAALS